MDKVINHGIPHVGELIFESIDTPELFQCRKVSETWKVLAENVLIKRWNGKMYEACKKGKTKVVRLLLERCNFEDLGLNSKDDDGWYAFAWACFNGHTNVVRLLLNQYERNINFNAKSIDGCTAFMEASFSGQFNCSSTIQTQTLN